MKKNGLFLVSLLPFITCNACNITHVNETSPTEPNPPTQPVTELAPIVPQLSHACNITHVNATSPTEPNPAPPTEPIIELALIAPEPSHVRFELYTSAAQTSYKVLLPGDDKLLQASGYSKQRPTFVIIHGFAESSSIWWMVPMRQALLQTGNRNVICVDWSFLAAAPRYDQAAFSTEFVGTYLARLLSFLNPDPKTVHIIGFSLGAQAAGFTGSVFKPGRITGLDPAGPAFREVSLNKRLDPSDAYFVDVIHTDAGDLTEGHLGLDLNCGHVDFYPNGGSKQPNCGSILPSVIQHLPSFDFGNVEACNHRRAAEYFTDSIYSNRPLMMGYPCAYSTFAAGRCRTTTSYPMGLKTPSSARGVVSLKTGSSSPFAVLTLNVEIQTGYQLFSVFGTGRLRLTFTTGATSVNVEVTAAALGFRPGQTLYAPVSLPPNTSPSSLSVKVSWYAIGIFFNMIALPINSIGLSTPDSTIRWCAGQNLNIVSGTQQTLAVTGQPCSTFVVVVHV